MAQRGAHARQQLADIERLVDVVVGPEIERVDLFRLALARRQNDDRHVRPFARALDDVLPISIWQSEIEEDNIRRLGRNAFDAVGDRTRACHLVVVGFQRRLEKAQDRRLVIDDQYAEPGAHAGLPCRGNVMMKRTPLPPSAGLSAAMLPPWASMMPLAMARPSPVPCTPSA